MGIRSVINKEIKRGWHEHTHPDYLDHEKWDRHKRQTEREMTMSNKLHGYEHYKNLYESVKPIRGRAEEVRPIGNRRRDWETVEKLTINGQDVYCARLYNTDCVQYFPDGAIKLMPESWSTPLTGDFMHTHSPFYVYKKYNKLWARLRGATGDMHYPITAEGVTFVPTDDGYYAPKDPVVIKQKVIDRDKAKVARAPYKPFLDWAKMFMKLSDGWIMAETKEQIATPTYSYWSIRYDYGLHEVRPSHWGRDMVDTKMLEYLSGERTEEDWLKCLCIISESLTAEERVLHKVIKDVENRDTKVYNERYSFNQIKDKLYRMTTNYGDVYKEVEVDVGGKAITKVV